MRHRSVRYQKQAEKQGTDGTVAAVSLVEGIAKVKELTNVKADRTYKGGKKRKSVDQTIELVVHLGIDPKQEAQSANYDRYDCHYSCGIRFHRSIGPLGLTIAIIHHFGA